jgi:TRAP-type C4-dicarboxylate transport system permease small subunit
MTWPEIIEKINEVLDKILIVVTSVALVFSTLLTFLGVILRYIFGISYEWNEELCRYSMIIIVYLWAGSMIRKNQHIAFTLFSDHFKGKSQSVHRLVINLLAVVFGIPIAIWGFQLMSNAMEAELRTLSLLFPLWPAYSIVPIGVLLIVVQAILDILRLSMTLFSKTRVTGF